MSITTVFDPPEPTDDLATFNAKAFDTLQKLNDWSGEANATSAAVNADATAAAASQSDASTSKAQASSFASAASASASAAATSAGAAVWASGTYSAGQAARSPSNMRVYIARTTGSKTTDPANDPTNWAIAGGELVLIVVSGTTQTAAVGGRYALRNAAASVLTAPPSPQAGDRFAVKVANGLTTNTINWNGAKHEGLSDATSTMERAGFAAEFVYIDATYGWGII